MKLTLAMLSIAAVIAAAAAPPARANVYGNPAPDFKAGEAFVQVSSSSDRRSIKAPAFDAKETFPITETMLALGFAVGDRGVLGFKYGAVTIGATDNFPESATGSEGGFFYRHTVGESGGTRHGLSVSYHWGGVSNDTSTTTFEQTDVSYGAAFPAGQGVVLYVAGLYSAFSGEIEVTGVDTYALESETNIGAYAGVEIKASPTFVLGAEVRAVAFTGFAAFAQLRF
jgi:hypothetical protein